MAYMYTPKDFFDYIDLNKESEFIIKNNSIKVLYIYRDINTRCTCYNQLHKCGDKDCKICGGDGFAKVVKVIDVFIDSGHRFNGIGGVVDIAGEGHQATHDLYIPPIYNDIIEESYFVVVKCKNAIPYSVDRVYYANDVTIPRATNGEKKYILVKGKLAPQLVKKQEKLINKMPMQDKINLMNGGVYKWMV